MALKKAKKKEILSDLHDLIKGSESMVFVGFDKLTVAQDTILRRNLRKEGIGYRVAKKTLLKKSLSEGGFAGELPEMVGEVALAYGKDLLAPAREVYNFQKTNKENIKILGGVFEGKFVDATKMMEIASIPGMQVLYGQFVNLINSPIQRFAVVLDQISKGAK